MNQMKVKGTGEYGEVLCRYFHQGLPTVTKMSKTMLLDVLTDIIIGTKEYRYGKRPDPESQVVIRDVIRKSIEADAPIPVLVPWGGRKMDPKLTIDIAEVSGIRQLIAVDHMVRQFFPKGLYIHIRVEDLNAFWLYKSAEGVREYSDGFVRLVNMMRGNSHLIPIKESDLMDSIAYEEASHKYSGLLTEIIKVRVAAPTLDVDTVPEYKEISSYGWKGKLPKEQLDYYLDRYKSLYPQTTEYERIKLLGDYLAGSFARYILKGRANPETERGFIQMNFSHPVPGAPAGIFNNTVYYRTIPASVSRTHIAPWRAKGYLDIINDVPVAKVAQWSRDVSQLTGNSMQLFEDGNDDNPLIIRADYIVSDLAAIAYMTGASMFIS